MACPEPGPQQGLPSGWFPFCHSSLPLPCPGAGQAVPWVLYGCCPTPVLAVHASRSSRSCRLPAECSGPNLGRQPGEAALLATGAASALMAF